MAAKHLLPLGVVRTRSTHVHVCTCSIAAMCPDATRHHLGFASEREKGWGAVWAKLGHLSGVQGCGV